MVAYSFKPQFEEPILSGTKCHTLRDFRLGRSRHARVGETLQLYRSMRTKQCKLLRTAECNRFLGAYLRFKGRNAGAYLYDLWEKEPGSFVRAGYNTWLEPEEFAKSDGFESFENMARFWWDTHRVSQWSGCLIGWKR